MTVLFVEFFYAIEQRLDLRDMSTVRKSCIEFETQFSLQYIDLSQLPRFSQLLRLSQLPRHFASEINYRIFVEVEESEIG